MSEKREFKHPKNHVGYVSKSKSGAIMITVEQDMVLKKGDRLIQRKPQEVLEGLLERGFIDEEKYEQRLESTPEWKLYEVSKMEFKDK